MADTDLCSHTFSLPEPDPAVADGDAQAKHLTEDDPGVWDDAWHCPREPLDEHNKCLFHVDPADRPQGIDISQAFLRALESANSISDPKQRRRHQQFIDVTFDEFVLRGEVIGNDSRSYVDFRYSKFANVDCSRAEFLQRMRFAHCTFQGSDDVASPLTDPDSRYDFSDIESIMFKSVDFRYNTDFTQSIFKAPVRFHGNQYDRWVSFTEATFEYPADFEMAEFGRMASFRGTKFYDGARMTATKFDGFAWFHKHVAAGPMFWYATRFRNDVDFSKSVLCGCVSFENGAFDFTADFSDIELTGSVTFAGVEADTLLFTPSTTGEIQYVNLIDAELESGQIGQPETEAVVYDLTDGTLGDVRFETGPDMDLLQWLKFHRTRYDGCDFSDSDDIDPAAANYKIHSLAPAAATVVTDSESPESHDDIVSTYVYAKNTSSETGNSVAAGSFFYREMIHRRKAHWNRAFMAGRSLTAQAYDLSQWCRNSIMSVVTGYGEHPDRVVYTSLAIIGLFSVIYAASDAVLAEATPVSATVFSIQSFVTLIFGDIPGETNIPTRMLSSTQGFLGAFFIALFVFTLTRRVHR